MHFGWHFRDALQRVLPKNVFTRFHTRQNKIGIVLVALIEKCTHMKQTNNKKKEAHDHQKNGNKKLDDYLPTKLTVCITSP